MVQATAATAAAAAVPFATAPPQEGARVEIRGQGRGRVRGCVLLWRGPAAALVRLQDRVYCGERGCRRREQEGDRVVRVLGVVGGASRGVQASV